MKLAPNRKSKALLAETQRMSHTGSWEWDKATGAFETSVELRRIFGFSPQRLDVALGDFRRAVHPDDVPMVKAFLQQALDGHEFDLEYRILPADGQAERTIHSFGGPFFDESGKLKAVLGTVQDITERKRMEQEIRGANAQLESQNQELVAALEEVSDAMAYSEGLMESMNDPVMVLDMQGVVTDVNQAYCRFHGMGKQESIGVPMFDLPNWPPNPQLRKLAVEKLTQLKKGSAIEERIEVPIISAGGAERIVSISSAIARDGGGQPHRIVLQYRDITERKKVEETLRRERDRAQKYLDVAGVMLLIIDTDRKVQLINRRGCEILGYGEDEIIGKNWFEHFLPERIRSDVGEVAEALESGAEERYQYFENPVLNSAGEERLIAWHNTVLRDEEGKMIGMLCSGEDITERKKIEQAIEKNSRLLTEAQRMAHMGSWEWDKSTGDFQISSGVRPIFGFLPEGSDISVDDFWRIVHPDDAPMVKSALKQTLDGHEFDLEYRILPASGREGRILHSFGGPFFDESGDLKAILGTVQDITERRRMEDEIRDANAQLESQNRQLADALKEVSEARAYSETLLGSFTDGLVMIDFDGIVRDVNQIYLDIFGMDREEVVGYPAHFDTLVNQEDREIALENIRLAAQGVITDDLMEFAALDKYGEEFVIDAVRYLVKDAEGNPSMLLIVIRDITERKRMEQEVIRQNEELKLKTMELEAAREELKINLTEVNEAKSYNEALVRSFNDGLMMIDFDGIVRDANEVFLNMIGCTREEVVGHPGRYDFLTTQEARERASENFRLIIKGAMVDDMWEYKVRNKRGEELIVETTRSLVKDASGKPFTMLAVVRDVTDRKRAEEKLKEYSENLEKMVRQRTRELEEAQEYLVRSERLATLGKFSGSLSHELRNPLGVIDSSAYYLKAKLKEADPKLLEHLDRIKFAAGNATAIIQSVLDLTRMGDPKQEKVDLRASVTDAVDTSSVPDTVEVILNLGEADIILDGDHEQLRMAFKNIIKNAVEAMDGEGRLEITLETGDNQAVISFADNGSGIAPDHLEEVFQPLFSTKAKGIGFGLAITRMVAEKHHGSVSAESVPGEGTRMIVRLPLEWMTKES